MKATRCVFGKDDKIQAHGKEAIERVREISDSLCVENDLSIIKEPQEPLKRYTGAEIQMIMREKMPFKEKLRVGIDYIRKKQPVRLIEFQKNLKSMFNIEMKVTNKNIAFKSSEQEPVLHVDIN